MSYQEKNIIVSFVSFALILGFFIIRVIQMVLGDSFNSANVFRLWGIVIVLAIVLTILGTILTHILSAIVQSIQTGEDDPEIDDLEDERDKLIDLRGTRSIVTSTSSWRLLPKSFFPQKWRTSRAN